MIKDDPFELFRSWYEDEKAAGTDPTPMTLATVGLDGRPAARVVLLKHFDEQGFVFYTNLRSRKALEIEKNAEVSLCFFWPVTLRQVRIEGRAELISDAMADEYFASRPRQRQLGAWASKQSAVLASRKDLVARYLKYKAKFLGKPVPRPDFWSGYRVVPRTFEFWLGDEYRLNHRTLYTRQGNSWEKVLLYP